MEEKTKQRNSQVDKNKIGEKLLMDGIINEDQVRKVLERQNQFGGRFGSLLIEMGFIDLPELLEYLSKKFGVPAVNLFHQNIEPEVLRSIPLEKMESKRVLPVSVAPGTLGLAMVNPRDLDTVADIEFQLGKKVKCLVVPAFMMTAALKYLKNGGYDGLNGAALAEMVSLERGDQVPSLSALLQYLVKSGASDMLLCTGAPPSVKMGNSVRRLSLPVLTPEDCEKYGRELLPPGAWEEFVRKNDYGMSASISGIGRFRITVFRERKSVAIALRAVAEKIPSMESLRLPGWICDYVLKPHGLILISGPSGHGKSTTLAALVDIINANRGCNIITLEDPVEYLHQHKKSNICQREVGNDMPSFYDGIRHIFRQAPDVIVVGELRDKETFRIALQAANSGHLVISTAHAENSTGIIERTINMFEPHEQNQIRSMLAESLILSLFQCLVPKKGSSERVLALEKFINTHRMRKFIREGKTHQIRSQLQSGAEDYTSVTIALAELFQNGLIEYDDGLVYADDNAFYQELAKPARLAALK